MPKQKVLIVDDNRDLAYALELRLQANGYLTLWARDGSDAISLAALEKPSTVILDLSLPKEDGLTVLAKLRAIPEMSGLSAIVISADGSTASKKRVQASGASAFFEKPVDHHALLETLRNPIVSPGSPRDQEFLLNPAKGPV